MYKNSLSRVQQYKQDHRIHPASARSSSPKELIQPFRNRPAHIVFRKFKVKDTWQAQPLQSHQERPLNTEQIEQVTSTVYTVGHFQDSTTALPTAPETRGSSLDRIQNPKLQLPKSSQNGCIKTNSTEAVDV